MADRSKWRVWLRTQHTTSSGVWLVLAKKGATHPTTLTYEEALDEAICFGWVDGQLGRRDEATYRRRFTPRSVRSPWSKRNVAIAERLRASGRMHRSGEERCGWPKPMVDGRPPTPDRPGRKSQRIWPCAKANPRAQAMFQELTSANRYSVIYRIERAKKVETRNKRIEQFVAMLERGETIHPQGAPTTPVVQLSWLFSLACSSMSPERIL